MKQILLAYTQYNLWANKRIIELFSNLDDDMLDKDLGGSFHTIRKTVYHIWGAESIWHQRLNMVEHVSIPQENYVGDFQAACKAWQDVSTMINEFVAKQYDDRGFEHEFAYRALKNTPMKSNVFDAIHHCMNHSTFHRGQLVNYARMIGITKIPSTDYITYCREKK
jgi:uncharacterized damage-inducible protein DinB